MHSVSFSTGLFSGMTKLLLSRVCLRVAIPALGSGQMAACSQFRVMQYHSVYERTPAVDDLHRNRMIFQIPTLSSTRTEKCEGLRLHSAT